MQQQVLTTNLTSLYVHIDSDQQKQRSSENIYRIHVTLDTALHSSAGHSACNVGYRLAFFGGTFRGSDRKENHVASYQCLASSSNFVYPCTLCVQYLPSYY